MASKRQLRDEWYGCGDGENFVFLFDDDGDPVAWCSRCLNCESCRISNFDGKISLLIEAKESFKEQHSNCQPRQVEAKQEVKQGDWKMGNCERSKLIEGWKRKTGLDYLFFYDTVGNSLSSVCNICKEKTEDYTLRDTKNITPQLADEMYSLKARIVSRHMGCGDKKEKQGEQPNLERFPSGSIRDSQEGRGRYDLIPASSYKRLAIRTELGAKRYGDNNWKKGQPIERYLNSMKRHITEYEMGDRSEDHLAAAAWNAFSAMWTEDEIKAGRLKV